MIYLASPYSAKLPDSLERDEVVEHKRYMEACIAAGFIMLKGDLVYSPIAHWHIIDQLFKGMVGYEDYLAADCKMIELCSEVHVLMIEGWDKSKGVLLEIEYAKVKNKPVKYFKNTPEGVVYADKIS